MKGMSVVSAPVAAWECLAEETCRPICASWVSAGAAETSRDAHVPSLPALDNVGTEPALVAAVFYYSCF